MTEKGTLIQKRGRVKGAITRIKTFADNINDQTDAEDISIRIAKLEEAWYEFQGIEDELMLMEGQISEMVEFETKYYDTKSILRRALRSRNSAQQNQHSSTTTEQNNLHYTLNQSMLDRSQTHLMNIRLPKINIPVFTGDYKEWPSFKDLYQSSVHDNESLTDSQKFQYLKGLLTGSAASVVRHLNVTDCNYREAWQKLLLRFDRKFLITTAYIKTFVDQPSLQQPSARNLRNLTDTLDEVIRGLKGLGADAEKRDAWLIYLATLKLDNETREQWSQEIATRDFPTFEDFILFLSKRCNALEACGVIVKRNNQPLKSLYVSTTPQRNICPRCAANHPIFRCETFKAELPIKRKEFVVSKALCFKCLGSNHSIRLCKSKMKCNKCKGLHHPLLHNSSTQQNPTTSTHAYSSSIDNITESDGKGASINPTLINTASINTAYVETSSLNLHRSDTSQVSLLPTAIVKVLNSQGKFIYCRILLDSGSQLSLISESCAQRLNIRRENARLIVTGLSTAGSSTTRGRLSLQLFARWKETDGLNLQVYVLNKLTSLIPSTNIPQPEHESIREVQLADPSFYKPSGIDIIVGANHFFQVLKEGKLHDQSGQLIAQETTFGWVLIGTIPHSISHSHTYHLHVLEDLDRTLRKFWETEEIEVISEKHTLEERRCETHFKQNLYRLSNRYVVSLPFKEEGGFLGDSLGNAIKRLKSMERKFQTNANFKKQYIQFMRDYEKLGHMELIPITEVQKNHSSMFYLPHHAVFKNSPNPKIRVVFDGSCKSSSGVSLNDKLMVGPTIQNDLATILLKFRKHKIAFCADVEKMYRQIVIAPNDRDFQRIVWREDASSPLQHYRLTTVTYGTASAPFLATRALHQIAEDFENQYPKAASIIKTSFYVDDLLSSTDTLDDALMLKTHLRDILAARGFNLTKWLSNSPQFLCKEKLTAADEDFMTINEDGVTSKILGIQWNSKLDVFMFKVTLSDEPENTKRKVLSESSKIFDPLGWLSPVTISIKILLQGLWLCKYNWDDPLPNDIVHKWKLIKDQLHLLTNIQIPRCILMYKERIQLHGFCDASELSYAAVIYCRSVDMNGMVSVRLIAAKTKVAPLRQVSLPRLELCGALLLTQLMEKVLKALELTSIEVFAWTDSTVVLAWLSDIPRRWKTYVANRTSEILNRIPRSQWNHVPSKQNPADPASRGIPPAEVLHLHLWWNGPIWLSQEPIEYPPQELSTTVSNVSSEQRKLPITINLHQHIDADFTELFIRCSSYSKTLRIVAYCLRFIKRLRHQNDSKKSHAIRASEINQAELICIRRIQQICFPNELKELKENRSVSSRSTLAALCPFLDTNEIIRVGGRLRYSKYNFNTKHPVILPKHHPISQALVSELHKIHLHPGSAVLTAIIRQRFWLLGARSIVKKVNLQCITCFRQRATRSSQLMAHLPDARMKITRPFYNVGIDYGGPIKLCARIGRGVRPVKGYFAVFICLTTRAVHLEAVTSVTAEAFVATLQRFVARRGIPTNVFCDNATNFVCGKRLLVDMHNLASSVHENDLISHFLSQNRITWNFIPPAAPHFGGMWEAAVKSTKWHLRRVVGDSTMSFEEFATLLTQIEAILNSRPYGIVSTDPDDFEALTPSHFLIGEPLTLLPEGDYSEVKISRLGRWQHIQSMVQGFWKRWKNEYLTSLQPRPKWRYEQSSLKQGELVLIGEDNVPPTRWPLGRVLEVHPGKDNLVRVVTIKTSQGIYKRSINKIYRLPIGQADA